MKLADYEFLDEDIDPYRIRREFEEEWAYMKNFTRPFSEKVEELYNLYEVTNTKIFTERTGLDGYQRRRLINPDNMPSMATLKSFY